MSRNQDFEQGQTLSGGPLETFMVNPGPDPTGAHGYAAKGVGGLIHFCRGLHTSYIATIQQPGQELEKPSPAPLTQTGQSECSSQSLASGRRDSY